MSALAASLGRGYLGEHRLTALGLALDESVARPFSIDLRPLETPAARPAWVATAAGQAQLAIVPVRRSLDPLTDTMPHPVVKLFPLPVAPPVIDVREEHPVVDLREPHPLDTPYLRSVAG